jgi:deoxyribonuclease IV
MSKIIGAHTIDKGGIDMAVLRAANGGMDAVQIFTTIPKFYGDKATIRDERVEKFNRALKKTGIEARNIISHASYALNVASKDEEKWARARAGLEKELERSDKLGIGAVCFHPGSGGEEREEALKRVAKAIVEVMRAVNTKTKLLIENTAGAGKTIGRSAEDIAAILSEVPAKLRARTGYGLDTCHLYASGYNIKESKKGLTKILDQFEEIIGEPPSFFHINDSKGVLGSNLDRHVLIGEGEIGKEAFEWLMKDRRTSNVPLILETPQMNYEIDDDDASPDPFDVKMVKILKSHSS